MLGRIFLPVNLDCVCVVGFHLLGLFTAPQSMAESQLSAIERPMQAIENSHVTSKTISLWRPLSKPLDLSLLATFKAVILLSSDRSSVS